jgi:FAD/FMN-containing dehydrogenase
VALSMRRNYRWRLVPGCGGVALSMRRNYRWRLVPTAAGGSVTELADHEREAWPRLASRHAAAARLRHQYAAIPPGTPVRLAKSTSNLFRFRESGGSGLVTLDVSAFTSVLDVDPDARTAIVGGMTTYEDLVDATLPHGLMPLVVPQLKTITLGAPSPASGSSRLRCATACRTSPCSKWRF